MCFFVLVQSESIKDRMGQFVQVCISLSLLKFLDDNDALLINSSNKVLALAAKETLHALHNAVILLLLKFQDHNCTAYVCIDVQFLGAVVNIYEEQVIKKKVLDKAVLVKSLLIGNDQILDLECCQFADHICVFIVSMSNQNVFQLIVITDLEILESLDKLTVCLGFYKRLDVSLLYRKI